MTLESLFHPATILFVIGFGFGLLSPQLHSRRNMMLAKFMGDGLMGMYLITVGGLAGACGALIAATGALIQGLLPINAFHKTVWIRIGAAVILSFASLYFIYQKPLDLLPLLMVIICRFGELQHDAQRIRIVYWLTVPAWSAYYFFMGLYLPLGASLVGFTSLSISIWRHRRKV